MFVALLKSVPGLEERLITAGSEEELYSIATLVRSRRFRTHLRLNSYNTLLRFKKEYQAPGLMIPKV